MPKGSVVVRSVFAASIFALYANPAIAEDDPPKDEIVVTGKRQECSLFNMCFNGMFGFFKITAVGPGSATQLMPMQQIQPAPYEEPYDPFANCGGPIIALPVNYYFDEDADGQPEYLIGPAFVCGVDENSNGVPDAWEYALAHGRLVPDL